METYTEEINAPADKKMFIQRIFHEYEPSERVARNLANALRNLMGDLYTEPERFIFELLQNADDKPAENSCVKIHLQLLEDTLIFFHNGKPFNLSDVNSICSIGDSTKNDDSEKIGYKGIGFKSVFANSDTVYINSGGFSFSFDKVSPLHNRAGNINEVPWQIKPIWVAKEHYPKSIQKVEAFFKSPVAIALSISKDQAKEYALMIPKLLAEPRFILFLRNVSSLKYIDFTGTNLSIQKEDNNGICNLIVNGKASSTWLTEDFIIDVSEDTKGKIKSDNLVPDKLKKAVKTKLTFAIPYEGRRIEKVEQKQSFLFSYLPTKVSDFQFPFLSNGDFLTTANRESIHFKTDWNVFLFKCLGSKIVDWAINLSNKRIPNYLDVLPGFLDEEDWAGARLANAFNVAYRKALEESAFIVNEEESLSKQVDCIIDKTGLSHITGSKLFREVMGTPKHLPADALDARVLERKPFDKIDTLNFADVISVIANKPLFSKLFVSLNDEQKVSLYKWIGSNDTPDQHDSLVTFASHLPAFLFSGEYISFEDITSGNYAITTPHIASVKAILQKLGIICSDTLYDESHPLFSILGKLDEKKLFEMIVQCDFSCLQDAERHSLFCALKDFDGIGMNSIKGLALLKNMNGKFRPLGEMTAYRENTPSWLFDHVLSKEDTSNDVLVYLIKRKEEFEKIIQVHCGEIDATFSEIHKEYSKEWTGQFTRELIDNYPNEIQKVSNGLLKIIEESDTETKTYFLNKIEKVDLSSNKTYSIDSYESRVLQLALAVLNSPLELSPKIYYDGQCIKNFTVTDDVICDFIQSGVSRTVTMSLSKLLPRYLSRSDVIDAIKCLFENKNDLDRFFDAKPIPLSDIYKEVIRLLGIPEKSCVNWKNVGGNAYQYLFAVYYRRKTWNFYGPYLPRIDLSNQSASFVQDLMTFLYENQIVFKQSPFTSQLSLYFSGKFFANEYILPKEQILTVLESWANDDEKKKYLQDCGVGLPSSDLIQMRRRFLDNNSIEFNDKFSPEEVASFLEFIATTDICNRPFTGENQKNFILQFKDNKQYPKLKITSQPDLDRIAKEAWEWNTVEYNKWIQNHYPHIFMYNGLIPRHLFYNDIYLIDYEEYDYCNIQPSDSQQNVLIVNCNRKICDLLLQVDENCHITNEDYRILCGNNRITEEELEGKNREIALLKNKLSWYEERYGVINQETTGNEFSEGDSESAITTHSTEGALDTSPNEIMCCQVDRGNLSKTEQIAAHNEAAIIIKEFLEGQGYDCSSWIIAEEDGTTVRKWKSASQVQGIIAPNGEIINLVYVSAKKQKIHLSATDFEFLSSQSNNLFMVWDGRDVHSVRGEEIFNSKSDVSLIFDTEYTPQEYYAALGKIFKFVKRSTFVIENPHYSATDSIQSFGMETKVDGVQESFTEEDL